MIPSYKNKKVLILGLGMYPQGSGITAAQFFCAQGAKVRVTDTRPRADLEHQIKKLPKKVEYVLGGHRKSDIAWADLIVKKPDVPPSSVYLQYALKLKKPIVTDTGLFLEMYTKPIVGITGTRGKSTTTALTHALLDAAASPVLLGGNITVSPLQLFLKKRDRTRLAVLELSSFMLEDLGLVRRGPHIAVITNLYPDHLNFHGSLAAYQKAKENIWRWQSATDHVVLNYDQPKCRAMAKQAPSQVWWFSLKSLPVTHNGAYWSKGQLWVQRDGQRRLTTNVSRLTLRGDHNLANVAAATVVATICRVPLATQRRVLRQFTGLPFRQELIRVRKGVHWYNDATSTTPEAGMAAMHRFGNKKHCLLIAGGNDKKLSFAAWAQAVSAKTKAMILIPGVASDRMVTALARTKSKVVLHRVDNLSAAVTLAQQLSKTGDTVVFSPAATSFNQFTNEFDRARQFSRLVRKLK